MRVVIIAIILIFTFSISFSQTDVDSVSTKKIKHALGGGIGWTTGVGLSYRITGDRIGFQTNFMPAKTNTTINYYLGFTVTFTLIETNYTRFYLYQGNFLHYTKYNENSNNYDSTNDRNIRKTWNNGIGIGVEVIMLKSIGINVMGGYASYDGFKRIGPTGEAGLYYLF